MLMNTIHVEGIYIYQLGCQPPNIIKYGIAELCTMVFGRILRGELCNYAV